jgi:hypothetical protein
MINTSETKIIAEIIPKNQSTMPKLKADEPVRRPALPPENRSTPEKQIFTPPYYPKAHAVRSSYDRQEHAIAIYRPNKPAATAPPESLAAEIKPATAAEAPPAPQESEKNTGITPAHRLVYFSKARRVKRDTPLKIMLYQAILTAAIVAAVLAVQLINPDLFAAIAAYISEKVAP